MPPEALVFTGFWQVVPPHWESGGQVAMEVCGGGQVRRGRRTEPPDDRPESRLQLLHSSLKSPLPP